MRQSRHCRLPVGKQLPVAGLAGRQSARKDFDAQAHAHMSRSDDMVRSQKPKGAGSSLPGNR
jgi:hypothetical protein